MSDYSKSSLFQGREKSYSTNELPQLKEISQQLEEIKKIVEELPEKFSILESPLSLDNSSESGDDTVSIRYFEDRLRDVFFKGLEEKTGWGKIQIKTLYEESVRKVWVNHLFRPF